MRLSENVYLVGGGDLGFNISHEFDCHVYVIDVGGELALIDAGAGVTIDPILENIHRDGLDAERLRYLILTHAHADHAGGARLWHEATGLEVAASAEAAQYLRDGDEEKVSLAVAKEGGFYPKSYRFQACPVQHILREGKPFPLGGREIEVYETPGHCSGMLSFVFSDGGKRFLFDGDTVFHGGRVLLTNVWDCDVRQYVHSVGKLNDVAFDALLPGHLALSLDHGHRHVEAAWSTMRRLTLPPNIL